MQFAGVLPEDAPDPSVEQWQRIARRPFPIFGLVPQRSVEEFMPSTMGSGSDRTGVREMHVGLTYLRIRNPLDPADPRNFADLDEETRRSLDEVPPWPRPRWLIDQVAKMRYPMLRDAVRTTWHRDEVVRPTIAKTVVDHTMHVLNDCFRRERGLEGRIGSLSPAPDVTMTSVQHDASLQVDGTDHAGVRIDTDPHVVAFGAQLDDHIQVSVVIARDEFPDLRLELARRPSKTRSSTERGLL